jgi:uncharacterized OB-fold protein
MNANDFSSATFYSLLAEHKLMGTRCGSCGALYLPPRPLCAACYSDDMAWSEFSGKGKLLAFTTIHIAPTAMIAAGYGRDNPYCTGIVQLEEGPAISAQILGVDATHPEQIAIGTPLQVAFVERGEGEEKRTYLAFRSS